MGNIGWNGDVDLLALTLYKHFTGTLLNATTEECAGCSMQQDPPARTMVLLFSAEGKQDATTFFICCILLY